MTLDEQKSILTIALYAAFSDGAKDDREREKIRRMAESLAEESDQPDLGRLYQDVLLKRVTIEDATTRLTDPATRQLAYEMAVCVCDADGLQSGPERLFLAELKALLQLDAGQTDAFDQEVEAIVQLSEATTSPPPPGEAVGSPVQTAIVQPNPSDAELDKSILHHALFNGALELLPQSWASMAIKRWPREIGQQVK